MHLVVSGDAWCWALFWCSMSVYVWTHSRAQNSIMPSAKIGNWHAKKYLDGQTKEKIASQNILGLPKQILMALNFFLFYALRSQMLHKRLVVRTVFAIFDHTVSWSHHKLTCSSASTLASDKATKILSSFCCDVTSAGSSKDFSCLLLSLWLYDQPWLWCAWVISQLRTTRHNVIPPVLKF